MSRRISIDEFDSEVDYGHYKRRTFVLMHSKVRLVLDNGLSYSGPGTIEVDVYQDGQYTARRMQPFIVEEP